MNSPVIEGHCEPRLSRVRDAFIDNFSRGEHGAAVAVMIDGRMAVDLWGGYADRAGAQPWSRNTIVNVFSATKGPVALCAHHLADSGRLSFDAPVARYWPEFARAGKEHIPVSWLLSHRAGLAAISRRLSPDDAYDWPTMIAALEEQKPWWTPGTRHGYHAMTFGWLVGEVVRRISGVTIGAYFRNFIAQPLGLDFHIGLDAGAEARCADALGARPPAPGAHNIMTEIAKNPDSLTARAFGNPPGLMRSTVFNSHRWRAAEIPSANGHGDARSLARLYGALAIGGALDGVRVLSEMQVRRCYDEQAKGRDLVLPADTRFSFGFMMTQPKTPFGPNPGVFGHPGAGGSIGFADPAAGIGFGYVMNRMGQEIILDPRARALIAALYDSL